MHWYVVHTKPRQEQRALDNLQNQGYECFLPQLTREKLSRGKLLTVREPLFPRYLFVRLDESLSGRSWAPIRSTLGVVRLVAFGAEPARLDDTLVERLREHEQAQAGQTQALFEPGERVEVAGGAFHGLEAVYQMTCGDSRVMVLIELLSKPTRLTLPAAQLRRRA